MTDSTQNSWFPTSLNTGLILGIITGILNVSLLMFTNPLQPSGTDFVIIGLVFLASLTASIIFPVRAVKSVRDEINGGVIKLGQAFLVAFVALLIASVISVTFAVLYLYFLAPDSLAEQAQEMKDLIMDQLDGASDLVVSMATSGVDRFINPMKQYYGLIMSGILSAVIAIIIAAVLKRDNPPIA